MILFATNDAGPAVYISQIIDALNEEFICVSSLASSRSFNKYGSRNQIVSFEDQAQYDGFFQEEFLNSHVSLIVAGTSWGSCVDKAVIKFGMENNIKVISIIEHWSWYRERFKVDKELRIPNYIIVNDEVAKSEAVVSGLPEDIIFSLGNPVLEKRSFEVNTIVDKTRWRRDLNIPDNKIVTFVSENYLQGFPPGSEYDQGFNEFTVLEDILRVITDQHHLVLKLHPNEPAQKYAKYANRNVSIFSEMDIPALTVHSDFIIGMGSMLLLEMALQRQDIVSYRPHDLKGFIGNTIGVTALVSDKNELKDILGGYKKIYNSKLQEKFVGSTDRIVNFIKGNL